MKHMTLLAELQGDLIGVNAINMALLTELFRPTVGPLTWALEPFRELKYGVNFFWKMQHPHGGLVRFQRSGLAYPPEPFLSGPFAVSVQRCRVCPRWLGHQTRSRVLNPQGKGQATSIPSTGAGKPRQG